MSFFYNLNKKLDEIRATPSTTHSQLNERDMGKHNNATTGFAALAKKAGKEYGSKAAGERVAGAVKAKMAKAGKLEEQDMDEAAKWRDPRYKDKLYTQEPRDYDNYDYGDEDYYNPKPDDYPGEKNLKGGSEYDHNDPLRKGFGRSGTGSPVEKGPRKGLPTRNHITSLKGSIKAARGTHAEPNLPESGMDESAFQAAIGKKKYGDEGMKALQKAGRDHASAKTMSNIRNKYDKYDESTGMADEGNESGGSQPAVQIFNDYDEVVAEFDQMPPRLRSALQGSDFGAVQWLADLARKDPDLDMSTIEKMVFSDGHVIEVQEYLDDLDEGKKYPLKEKMSPAKAKSFAALAPPRDKITFADKIAGAKKEVDEMLGDVAAEAIKSALSPKQKKMDMNKNGRLDANDFAMLRKGGKKQVADEGWDEMEKDVKGRMSAPKVGSITHGHKHDIEHTATGRRVTRRTDDQGISVGADDASDAQPEKRGRGRPKGAAKGPERVTANATKHKGGRKMADEDFDRGEYDQEGGMAKDDIKTIVRHAQALSKILGDNDNLPEWVQSKLAKIEEMMSSVDDYMQNQKSGGQETELDEKAVSKKQQRFMGMVHATQKGEKAPSKAVAKVAKEMPKKAAKDFASTKQKGLPEKAPKKDTKSAAPTKKEKTEEAGGTGTPTASSGFSYGKGIYDSMNRELETMIKESMNVSMNMNSDAHGGPEKSLTVTATDDDAMKLGELLKNAGLGGDRPNVEGGADVQVHGAEDLADQIRSAVDAHDHGEHSEEPCPDCGQAPCGCESVDEAYGSTDETLNQPDWPTNTEHAQDNLGYAGGLNKPKIDVNGNGQTTVPNQAVHTQDEDALHRLREMAGITQEGKVVDALKAGAKAVGKAIAGKNDDELLSKLEKETGGKRPEKKDDKKMEESIFSLTNQWKQYKAQ